MTLIEALEEAKQMADLTVTIADGTVVPAFYIMSDARDCAMLLRETTGKQFYAREYQCDILDKTVYAVY